MAKMLDRIYHRASRIEFNFRDMIAEVKAKYGQIPTFFGALKNPIGIEVELEGATYQLKDAITHSLLWKGVEDNSLKDEGWELVSVPLGGHMIDYAFHELGKLVGKQQRYSHRCSVHVHMNMSGFSEEQLQHLFMYYVVLEDALFSYCDPVRKASSFCVPITDLCPMGNDLLRGPESMKYCAFNTAPLHRQLTVEVRMHEGTHDLRKLRRWVQILCKMHRYATSRTVAQANADMEKLEAGDLSPIEDMLTVHYGLFDKQALQQSAALGIEWLSMYKD